MEERQNFVSIASTPHIGIWFFFGRCVVYIVMTNHPIIDTDERASSEYWVFRCCVLFVTTIGRFVGVCLYQQMGRI